MWELIVELLINDRAYTDRVMFCTWGGDILERQHAAKQDCDPMDFDTKAECEKSALWYGTIATANAVQKNPDFFLGKYERPNKLGSTLKVTCVSTDRVS